MVNLKVLLLLLLSPIYLYSQNKIDSLKSVISDLNEKERVDVFTELSRAYYVSNADSAILYGEKALELAKKIDDPLKLGKAYNALGTGYQAKKELDKSYENYKKALEIILQINDLKSLASIYNNIGSFHLLKNEFEKALEMYYKSIEIEEQINNPLGLTKSYVNVGIILSTIRQFDRSLEYYRKGLGMAVKNKYLSPEIQVKVAMMKVFNTINQLDSSIYYGRSALELSRNNDFLIGIARTSAYLSSPLIRNGLFQEGLEVSRIAENAFIKFKDNAQVDLAKLNQAYAYEGLKQYDLAIKIGKELKKKPFRYWSPSIDRLLYQVEKKRGNYQTALKYYEDYRNQNDSISSQVNLDKLADLEKKYETEKKEREIEGLQQKSKIQQLELEQKNTALIVTVIFIILIGSAGYLFYNQKRLKHERSISDMEQKFLRFQMNPHFIFNSLTSIQNFMLKNDAKMAGIYMAKFAKLMRQILEHSRQDFISITDEVNTLENYMDLQKLRLNNKFDYEIQVDETLDDEEIKIPPMFAQPFIENALEHGILHLEQDGKIKVNFVKDGDLVKIEVEDNGIGLQASKELDIRKNHTSLATKITQERISLFNKELKNKIKLVIDNVIDSSGTVNGTKVNVMVPFQ